MQSALFFKDGGRSANVMLRFGKDFFFAGEGRVCIEVERSKFAALGRSGIVDDLNEEGSFGVPVVSFVLDWVNNTENRISSYLVSTLTEGEKTRSSEINRSDSS